jgi:hypothetical protein
VVNEDGDVKHVHLNQKHHPALDEEAMHVVSSSPKWVAAYKNGSQISSSFAIPIAFEFHRIKDKTAMRPGILQGFKNIPLQFVKEAPKFEDTDFNSFVKLFNRYLIYPFDAKHAGIGGKVLLKFTVGGDNKLWGVSAIGPNKILEDEVYRVMNYQRILDGWTAGRERGQDVNTNCVFVVTFDHKTKTAHMTSDGQQLDPTKVYTPPTFMGVRNQTFREFVENNQR